MTIRCSAVLAAAFALPALVCPAWAQDADPRAVLEASAAAAREVPGFASQFRLTGEGSELIKSTMPAMSGRLVFGRTDNGAVMHALGESRDTASGPPTTFDILRTIEKLSWTDDAKRTINTRRASPEPRDMPGPARLMHLVNLLQDDAFAETLARAESLAHEGVKSAGGETCDVVLVSFPKPQAGGRGGPSHTAERWFIAQSDKLPRRLEQITDAGMIKYSLVTELSNLSIGEQKPEDLDIRRPDDYTVNDQTAPRPEPTPPPVPSTPIEREPSDTPGATGDRPEPVPALPAARRAPDFSFTPDGGTKVDNATQQSRVTVLYFWGTWCIPCRAVSPKVSEIATALADKPVDVFAPAIRERDVDAPRAYLADNDFAQRLVLGVDTLASAFRVRVYPTIVVIAPDGTIAFEGHPGPERTPDALAAEVRATVEKLLPQG
jgi:thiol-disulfide isomerase/thioredoxin